jgi:hypothetical protein
MNELQLLNAAWEQPAPPSAAAFQSARASLLDLANGDVRRAGRRWRMPRPGARLAVAVTAVAAAVAVIAGITVSGTRTPRSGSEPATLTAVVVLEKAAAAAQAQPFTAPRPGPWIYIKVLTCAPQFNFAKVRTRKPVGKVVGPNAPLVCTTGESWAPVYGTPAAAYQDNAPISYAALMALPKTPAGLLGWARRNAGPANGDAFQILDSLLYDNLLPPPIEAATFRALALIPGVTLIRDTTDIQGRPALGICYDIPGGWLRVEILLNPSTYAYLGERDVAIANYTTQTTGPRGRIVWGVRKGQVWMLIAREAAAVVDRPGQLP